MISSNQAVHADQVTEHDSNGAGNAKSIDKLRAVAAKCLLCSPLTARCQNVGATLLSGGINSSFSSNARASIFPQGDTGENGHAAGKISFRTGKNLMELCKMAIG